MYMAFIFLIDKFYIWAIVGKVNMNVRFVFKQLYYYHLENSHIYCTFIGHFSNKFALYCVYRTVPTGCKQSWPYELLVLELNPDNIISSWSYGLKPVADDLKLGH